MEREIHSLILEGKYKGNVITRNLPQHIDNGLYTLIHFIGGMDFRDVIDFADNATEYEIEKLSYLLNKFPNTIQDIMPLAGNFKVLLKSPEYQEIVNLVKRMDAELQLDENLNDLIYREKPKDKHIKRMEKDLGPLEGFPIEKFKNYPPPKNESETTDIELEDLKKIPVDKKFIERGDDLDLPFKIFLNSKGLEYPLEVIKTYMAGVRSIILKLKYHYNRPRPFQLADIKGVELNSEYLDSASTPSYPSGHATQGRFVARVLSDLYPEYEQELMNIGDDVSYSRNMAKVHYPSDTSFGKELGDEFYEYIQNQTITENVEIDADGYYTSDTNPYVLRYITPKTKRALFKHWDSVGKAEWSSLKLFGMEGEDIAFDNVADVLYPLLVIEWLGGIENTPLATEDWMEWSGDYPNINFKYKIIPLRFDYLFDESESFGEHGYSCYDIKVIIDGGAPGPEGETREALEEIFPKDKRNKLIAYRDHDVNTTDLVEELWETTEYIRSDVGVRQFCRVEIEVVNP